MTATLGPPVGAKPVVVALVGPPNSGKSTLFNRLTGLRQKVANDPGVTVEQRRGRTLEAGMRPVELVDLPGTYALDRRSDDERIATGEDCILVFRDLDAMKEEAELLRLQYKYRSLIVRGQLDFLLRRRKG